MRLVIRRFPALLVGLLVTIGGCGIDVVIDPPHLTLDLGPPPPPRIVQVDVTNGAGKTVMSGQPDPLGDLSADPDLSDLDGTLTIVSTWSDGRKTTQTITHTANTRLALIYDRDLRNFVASEPAAAPSDAAKNDPGGD